MLGAPGRADGARLAGAAGAAAAQPRGRTPRPGRRVVAFGRAVGRAARTTPTRTRRRRSPRSRWSCSRRRSGPTRARRSDYMREREMDLKLISGDAPQTVTAVASAVGIPAGAGVVDRRRAPRGPRLARPDRGGEHDLLPDPAGAEEGAGLGAGRARPVRRDDRRRGERRPGAEAREDGGGDGIRAARSRRGSRTSCCSRTSSRGCRARSPRAAGSRGTSTGSAGST